MSDEKLIDAFLHHEQLEAVRLYYERTESFARRIRVGQMPKLAENIKFPKISDITPPPPSRATGELVITNKYYRPRLEDAGTAINTVDPNVDPGG